jgi:hypothetical protein
LFQKNSGEIAYLPEKEMIPVEEKAGSQGEEWKKKGDLSHEI